MTRWRDSAVFAGADPLDPDRSTRHYVHIALCAGVAVVLFLFARAFLREQVRRSEVLDAAIKDVLTSAETESTRTFYGEPDGTVIGLERGSFPEGYAPRVAGYTFVDFDGDSTNKAKFHEPRMLVITLSDFVTPSVWSRAAPRPYSVQFGLYNGGGAGTMNGWPGGACTVEFSVTHGSAGTVATLTRLFDP